MASSFDDFKTSLEKALGIDDVPADASGIASDPLAATGGGGGANTNPRAQIKEQARYIAEAVKEYLKDLAGSEDFVKKPGGS